MKHWNESKVAVMVATGCCAWPVRGILFRILIVKYLHQLGRFIRAFIETKSEPLRSHQEKIGPFHLQDLAIGPEAGT